MRTRALVPLVMLLASPAAALNARSQGATDALRRILGDAGTSPTIAIAATATVKQ